MRFKILEPEFVKRGEGHSFSVCSREEAEGVLFLCPRCFLTNNGPIGTHSILCWAPVVPAEYGEGPGRWALRGNSFDDLSLDASPQTSIHLTGPGCGAHFTVKEGEVAI